MSRRTGGALLRTCGGVKGGGCHARSLPPNTPSHLRRPQRHVWSSLKGCNDSGWDRHHRSVCSTSLCVLFLLLLLLLSLLHLLQQLLLLLLQLQLSLLLLLLLLLFPLLLLGCQPRSLSLRHAGVRDARLFFWVNTANTRDDACHDDADHLARSEGAADTLYGQRRHDDAPRVLAKCEACGNGVPPALRVPQGAGQVAILRGDGAATQTRRGVTGVQQQHPSPPPLGYARREWRWSRVARPPQATAAPALRARTAARGRSANRPRASRGRRARQALHGHRRRPGDP